MSHNHCHIRMFRFFFLSWPFLKHRARSKVQYPGPRNRPGRHASERRAATGLLNMGQANALRGASAVRGRWNFQVTRVFDGDWDLILVDEFWNPHFTFHELNKSVCVSEF